MDLVVIAQIITGIATLLVASVLIYQLRIQHNDSVRDFAYQKTEHHLSRMRAVYENKDFRKIFAKRDYDRENISDEEYLALDYYFRVMIANQNTNNRLGGEEDIRMLKFLLRNVVISTKIGDELLISPDKISIITGYEDEDIAIGIKNYIHGKSSS